MQGRSEVAGGPVRLIIDTDMYTDNDSGSLALAHILADRGECEIVRANPGIATYQRSDQAPDAVEVYRRILAA